MKPRVKALWLTAPSFASSLYGWIAIGGWLIDRVESYPLWVQQITAIPVLALYLLGFSLVVYTHCMAEEMITKRHQKE